ncbi:MAG: hypothetical protein H7318_03270 [Oligoflexus sp.]|nr:hypothetical protein [Oligoflexus sp.]
MSTPLQDFTNLVHSNLEKNGFPDKSVSFPLEKMYESASERGFSFNKVRDELREMEVLSEIVGDRIVFTKQSLPDFGADFDMSKMAEMAQQMLAKMSPEQQAQITQMMQNMSSEQMAGMREHWENMPSEEKPKARRDLKP